MKWFKRSSPPPQPKEWCVMYRTLGRAMWCNTSKGHADSKADATRMTIDEAKEYCESANGSIHPDWWCEIVKA